MVKRLAAVLLFLLGVSIILLLATPTVLVDVWRAIIQLIHSPA